MSGVTGAGQETDCRGAMGVGWVVVARNTVGVG